MEAGAVLYTMTGNRSVDCVYTCSLSLCLSLLSYLTNKRVHYNVYRYAWLVSPLNLV